MNFFQLILKQMRQRALSTWLTLLSVMLGVGLAVSIMIFQREAEKLFGQSDYGYDLLIGAKGSPLQLVLNSVYHLDRSPGNIPYSLYEGMSKPGHPQVRWALPVVVGDLYEGFRVVGTAPHMFPVDHEGKKLDENRVFQYRFGKTYGFAEGRPFHPMKFEAVVGAEVAKERKLAIGSKIQVQHSGGGEHGEAWTITGILKPTRTAGDRAVYVPLVSSYAIPEHEKGMEEMHKLEQMRQAAAAATKPAATAAPAGELMQDDEDHDEHGEHDEHDHAYHLNPDGTIELHLEKEKWKLSAIFVRSRGGYPGLLLQWQFNNLPDAMAVIPAMVMREFFDTFLKGSARMLLFIALLVTVVAAVSILVSIYNSVSARRREIAILRALGATRRRVLTLICLEAAIVGLVGGVLGVVVGHLLAAGGSVFVRQLVGEGIGWLVMDRWEWVYLGVVVVLAGLAGLVPAMKAYRIPVATYLVAE